MPAPLGLVKTPYQWPSFSAGVTFASALLSLPDLDSLQRRVAMAIRIQLNQIWLLYLIKCSLKRKSHCVPKEGRHSQGAIMFSDAVLPLCPTLGPVCPLPELTDPPPRPVLVLPNRRCHGKSLDFRGERMGGGGHGKCQSAVQKTLLQFRSNGTNKRQDQVHNEAALETLIGRVFFSSPSSFCCDVSPVFSECNFHSDSH